MKKLFGIISKLFLLAVIPACTAPVFFEKTLPPEISVSIEKATASLVNTFNFALQENEKEKYREAYDFAATELLHDLFETFQNDNPFRILEADTLQLGNTPYFPGANLPPEFIRNYCQEKSTPYLLAVSSLSIWFSGENANEEDEYAKPLSIRSQNVFLLLQAELSLYDSSGSIVNRQTIAHRVLYRTRSSLTSEVWLFTPGLKKAAPSITILAKGITKDYYDRFHPKTVTESKILFAGKGFGKMRRYIDEGNWDAAIKELLPLADSQDPKQACRAAYNLAVIYEIIRNMPQHEFWLNKSGGIKPQESIHFSY
jgi:hypothetical protein